MSRNYEEHPEMFPSPAVAVADYDPDLDGWKADAHAELRKRHPAGDGKVLDGLQPRGVLRLLPALPRVEAARRTDGEVSYAQGLPVAKPHRAEGPVSRSTFQDDAWYLGVKQPVCCEGSRSQGEKQ